MGLYPLRFHPILKERVWGGRKLEQLFGKALPPQVNIGESWEVSDRPCDASVIANGRFAGRDLHWLMLNHAQELLGPPTISGARFPLLVKLLDASQTLSLQVHPPTNVARKLGGEPKTEMWYVAEADPDAKLYVGLKRGVTPGLFKEKLAQSRVAECFHEIRVKAGDAMFLPSGRVHAIGAGLVIFEIQQNSDTTYRVFDWNRVGPDGKPRELHITESIQSIDFNDFEPGLCSPGVSQADTPGLRKLVDDALFSVGVWQDGEIRITGNKMRILGVVRGTVRITSEQESVRLGPGQFCLLPYVLSDVVMKAEKSGTAVLVVEPGKALLA